MLQKYKIHKHIVKHAHIASLHLSALLLVGLSFFGVNETTLESFRHIGQPIPNPVPTIEERKIPHEEINLGGMKMPTISGS